jgi:hypothetical protein
LHLQHLPCLPSRVPDNVLPLPLCICTWDRGTTIPAQEERESVVPGPGPGQGQGPGLFTLFLVSVLALSLAPRGTRPRKRLLPLSTCQDLADLWSPLPALPAPSSGPQTPSCWPLQAPSIGHLLALGLDAVGLRCPSALPFSPRSVVVYRCRPCRPRRPLLCDTWTPALSSVLVLPSINLISIA